ncbi:uncharacterized protein [Physcomitrium patens]|uniref:uncharacterized protein n=1 Tax=Physcomitrium patens TaxID=3218 RepID=UPI003CCC904C
MNNESAFHKFISQVDSTDSTLPSQHADLEPRVLTGPPPPRGSFFVALIAFLGSPLGLQVSRTRTQPQFVTGFYRIPTIEFRKSVENQNRVMGPSHFQISQSDFATRSASTGRGRKAATDSGVENISLALYV